jgi:biopolymer transport protein ExbB
MELVNWLEQIMVGFGAGWVMWLLIGLSVLSVAVILERAWFFYSLNDDLDVLARDLRRALDKSLSEAKKRMDRSPSAEAAVVYAGLEVYDKGPRAAEEAMDGAKALQRMKLEKRLVYLATLGNNAPFIGLFGTVIGIIGAFQALGEQAQAPLQEVAQQALAPKLVMVSISEALVATAVGIAVAIPAVAANNFFQRSTKRILANTEALTKVLLAHMKSEPAWVGPPTSDVEDEEDAPKAARKSKRGKKGSKEED